MGQTVNKRSWIPFIAAAIAFLFFAMHDSLLYGIFYLESFVQYKALYMHDWASFIACVEGLLVFAALYFTATGKKTPAIALSFVDIILAVIPMFYSSHITAFIGLEGGSWIEVTYDPLRQRVLIYSVIFALVNACIIAYNFTKTRSFWCFVPLGKD